MTLFDDGLAAFRAKVDQREAQLLASLSEVGADLTSARRDLEVAKAAITGKDQAIASQQVRIAQLESTEAQLRARIAELEAGTPTDPTDPTVPAPRGMLIGTSGQNGQDQTPIEVAAGRPIGVRREYFDLGGIDGALNRIKFDVSKGRLPWPTFKFGASWTQVIAGAVDAKIRDLRDKLLALDVEVWCGFHHEPEGDEADHSLWPKAQQRVAAIFAEKPGKVSLWFVVQSWPQTYEKSPTRGVLWDQILPTNLPAGLRYGIGIDPYNWFPGPKNDGSKGWSELDKYFEDAAAQAKKRGWMWAVAESACQDAAYADARGKGWVTRTLASAAKNGAAAFAWFNTSPSGDYTWRFGTAQPGKLAEFVDALKASPRP